MGRLIPAGTGLGAYKRLTVDVKAEDEDEDDIDTDALTGDEPVGGPGISFAMATSSLTISKRLSRCPGA
jgi:hypothetical protein